MSAILPGLGLIAFEVIVWTVAYRLQPAPTSTGVWRRLDSNVRIIGANVAVICVNVGLLVIAKILSAVLS